MPWHWGSAPIQCMQWVGSRPAGRLVGSLQCQGCCGLAGWLSGSANLASPVVDCGTRMLRMGLKPFRLAPVGHGGQGPHSVIVVQLRGASPQVVSHLHHGDHEPISPTHLSMYPYYKFGIKPPTHGASLPTTPLPTPQQPPLPPTAPSAAAACRGHQIWCCPCCFRCAQVRQVGQGLSVQRTFHWTTATTGETGAARLALA